jgi:lipoprotein-releasing system permease protein
MILTFVSRYLLKRQRVKAINLIAFVSIAAIAIGSAALILVLSSYNGIDNFVRSLYTSFYTDVSIHSKQGKHFEASPQLLSLIKLQPQVVAAGQILDDKVLLQYQGKQSVAILRGVDEQYNALTNFTQYIRYGDTIINTPQPRIVLGLALSNTLKVSEQNISPLSVFSFNKNANFNTAPLEAYNQTEVPVSGIFSVADDFDGQYAIASLQHAQVLLNNYNSISAIAIKLRNEHDATNLIAKLQPTLQQYGLEATTRYQQNKTLYYILNSEKWMVYALLSFILAIASFNIIASLSMLVLDKQRDIKILKAMGASQLLIKKIFLSTGIGIGIIGAIIGMAIALILCLVQIKYQLLQMGGGNNMLLQAYPVQLKASDFVLVFATVIALSAAAAYWPARKAVQG